MKVLITGSQGYVARNVCKKLSKSGITCYGIGRGNWKKKADFKKWGYYQNISSTINKKSLRGFKNNKFDYIIHLAGGSSPIVSMINSDWFQEALYDAQDFKLSIYVCDIKSKFRIYHLTSKN